MGVEDFVNACNMLPVMFGTEQYSPVAACRMLHLLNRMHSELPMFVQTQKYA